MYLYFRDTARISNPHLYTAFHSLLLRWDRKFCDNIVSEKTTVLPPDDSGMNMENG